MSARIGCRDLRVVTRRGRELLAVERLDVAAGRTLAVLGPNGAGKSTLLRALALLRQHQRLGEVLLDGRPATPAAMRVAVAAVLQRPILRRGTVAANVAAGLRLRGVRREDAARQSAPWLEALHIAHLADRDARSLSTGEAQRVSIARALAVRPRVLLLDEPFAGLDAVTRTDLLADLRAVLEGFGAATILVTHDRHEARALAADSALLLDGRIRCHGPTAEVLEHPRDADGARLLGFANLLGPELTGLGGQVVARPEHCRPLRRSSDAPSGVLVVAASVGRVVPLGGVTRLDLATADGSLTTLSTDGPGAFAMGDAVHVAITEWRPLPAEATLSV